MIIKRTSKIWLGLGAAALIGTGMPGAVERGHAQSPTTHAPQANGTGPAQVKDKEGAAATTKSEGGEGGESGGAGLDPRVKFARDMGLVRGHLRVGTELVQQGRWDDALPHFHHPIEELYPAISPVIKRHGLKQFDAALKALAQAVLAKKPEAFATATKVVESRMASVDAGVRKFATDHAIETLKAAIAMLQAAGGEYGQAIEDGRIAKPVEYQDSRGFVFHAEQLIEQISAVLAKKDAGAVAAVRAGVAELKKAWPTAVPPSAPVKTTGAVLADISRIELAAGSLLQ